MSPILYVIIKKIIAVLKVPRRIGDKISYASAIHNAMKSNLLYAGSQATLQLLDTAIQDLAKKQSGLKQKPPIYTTTERDEALVVVLDLLNTLKLDVQKLADADKPNAESIVEGASMHVKKITIREKRKNSVENGPEPGMVLLTAEGEGAHEWQISTDNEIWSHLKSTLGGETKSTNHKAGDKLYFRNRTILPNDEYGEWSVGLDIWIK